MITQEYKTEVLGKLGLLDEEKQEAVLIFIRSLITIKTKGIEGNKLLSFAGTIQADDLQVMKKSIEEGCEKVHPNDW